MTNNADILLKMLFPCHITLQF